MSMQQPEEPDAGDLLEPYVEGEDRYVRFVEDILGLRLASTQKRVLRAIEKYQRVVIVSGNGVGKSYGVAGANLAFLFANLYSLVMLTSGSYSMLTDTTWKPMQTLHKKGEERFDLPGRRLQNPPRLEIPGFDEWYFKAISPSNPDSLEGRHADHMLVVIEEADKPDIGPEHLDSAGSSITDENDRMVVVANPPKSEANVVYDLMESDRWHTIQFSSFDSHNVLVDADRLDDDPIPGLVDLPTVAEDFEEWNNRPWPRAPEEWDEGGEWPGVSALMQEVQQGERQREEVLEYLRPGFDLAKATEEERGLHTRWYRRRLGIIPPDDAAVPRPFRPADVSEAGERWEDAVEYQDNHGRPIVDAVGIDVARSGGDRTVVYQVRNEKLVCTGTWTGKRHTKQAKKIAEALDLVNLQGPIAVDAVGEGSGLADMLIDSPRVDANVIRFKGGENAQADQDYDDKRAEALAMFGDFLADDGAIDPKGDLAFEARAASRVIEFEEKEKRGGTVFSATSKDELKEETHLGRSPDHLDAGTMAAYAYGDFGKGNHRGLTW